MRQVFNSYFNSTVKKLNIPIRQNLLNDASAFDDHTITVVHTYERHPSVFKIKEKVKNMTSFLFIMLTPIKC